MAVILRSDAIAPGDRVEFIREAIWQGVLPVEIDWQQSPEELELICRIAVAGPLNFSSARSATNGIRRTSRLAGVDHDPRIFVAIQVSGTTRIEQAGHQSELARGDMVVYDSTKPYSIVNVDRTELHYFQIPRSTFAVPDRILDQVLGVRIGPDNNSLAGLVAPYFASLGSGDVLDQPGAAELVAEPSIQLLRALVTHQVADREASTESFAASLTLRIQQHVQAHLGDRDLGAASIASAHNISVRHLYATMARAGVGLRDSIQQQRLERCRADLRDPRLAHLAVATIGSRWGFVDPSHFGRVFRTAYGMTPNEWRRSARR
ncbi:helix-turn-helix domain-containing protein [Microlunatus aurantiacus]|uniref:Helix-turn-helix domain-containing protein n=1 Tax=Microlunatus aurantiacus TaxID=446786 RepID=A0ABP7D4K5_9ACTN